MLGRKIKTFLFKSAKLFGPFLTVYYMLSQKSTKAAVLVALVVMTPLFPIYTALAKPCWNYFCLKVWKEQTSPAFIVKTNRNASWCSKVEVPLYIPFLDITGGIYFSIRLTQKYSWLRCLLFYQKFWWFLFTWARLAALNKAQLNNFETICIDCYRFVEKPEFA